MFVRTVAHTLSIPPAELAEQAFRDGAYACHGDLSLPSKEQPAVDLVGGNDGAHESILAPLLDDGFDDLFCEFFRVRLFWATRPGRGRPTAEDDCAN